MATATEAPPPELAERLAAAGIVVPRRAESVLIDCAGDPPLGRSAGTVAREEPERLVRAVGAAMVAARAKRGVIAVRDREGEAAVARALRMASAASVTVRRAAAVWPSTGIDRDLGCAGGWLLDAEAALDLEAAAFAVARAARRITVAGSVGRPGVLRFAAAPSVGDLVARAGGATARAWVALDGGALGGRLADEEAMVRRDLVLILPAAHPIARRAQVSLADWLRRAASACEGCRACSEVCPVYLDGGPLQPHEVIWTLVSGRSDGTRLAEAAACSGCAVCESACPSAIAPGALVAAVRDRLAPIAPVSPRGAPHPDRAGRQMGVALLERRLAVAG